MVPIRQYKKFWEFIKTAVSGIDRVAVVSTETEMEKFIKDVSDGETILLAVLPSSDTEATSVDDLEEVDPCFVFILRKISERDVNEDELFAAKEQTQQITTEVKRKMWRLAEDFDSQDANTVLMRRLVLNKMHTDPEPFYLGTTGWSLSFLLKTVGVFND